MSEKNHNGILKMVLPCYTQRPVYKLRMHWGFCYCSFLYANITWLAKKSGHGIPFQHVPIKVQILPLISYWYISGKYTLVFLIHDNKYCSLFALKNCCEQSLIWKEGIFLLSLLGLHFLSIEGERLENHFVSSLNEIAWKLQWCLPAPSKGRRWGKEGQTAPFEVCSSISGIID